MTRRGPAWLIPLIPLAALATTPAEEAELRYQEALAAIAAKDLGAAGRALEACVATDPTRAACWWELGWVRWTKKDWVGVVNAWETVARLEPQHPELPKHLPTARGKLVVEKLIHEWAKSPPPPRDPPPRDARLRLRAVGDVMMGSDFPEPPLMPEEDGKTYFAAVGELLRDADLTFVNLEGPLCDTGTTTKCKEGSNCYAFRTPTRYASLLQQVGVDLVSTANNHANDFGEVCRLQTEAALAPLGMAYSGRHGTVATVEKNGIDLAMIAFHSADSAHNLNELDTAVALVKGLAARHDVVVVSFHGGAEGSKALNVPVGAEMFYGENRGDLRRFTRAVIDAGADLVIGHGPHVPRALELYQGRLIAYSLGNFATYGRFNLKGNLGVSLVLEAELDAEGRFLGGAVIPTLQEGLGVPAPDPAATVIPLLRELGAADFPGSAPEITDDGRILPRPAAP